ncbi:MULTISPECIES: copper uptake system-associated protein [Bacteria]|uniref:Lipoprotein n=1 Tax=Lysobacter enzymogenes TaxID=69 RepID=A0AAU9AHX9_LYSEN|nr:hypothetical protein MCC10107_1996 [Bifidobacterium longum subsp. longum]BAV95754.1 conserved hypothetical protein [Lysobacter enzymogenes]
MIGCLHVSTLRTLALASLISLTACAAPEDVEDRQAIRATLIGTWTRPYTPLRVEPIALAGPYAIADWFQGAYAGRVLLEKRGGQWHMRLCSGDALKNVEFLQEAGVNAASARRLSDALRLAEAKLSTDDRDKLARFRGVVQLH